MFELHHVSKAYGMGDVEVRALNDVSFGIGAGRFVVMLGPSGSGNRPC
jgi:putative ABC transport system ATP-binding protein